MNRRILALILLAMAPSARAETALHARIGEYLTRHAVWGGPNCHQTTLFARGFSNSFRYVDSTEFEESLRLGHCSPLSPNEPHEDGRREGDIGLILDREDGVVHSFTWLSKGRVFSKTGAANSFSASIQSWDTMNAWFHVKPECARPGTPLSANCPRVVTTWRCGEIPTTPAPELPEALLKIQSELSRLEDLTSHWVRQRDLPPDAELDREFQVAAQLRSSLQAWTDPHPRLALLRARAFSIERQLVMFADPD
jgi:hypothetical protein